MSKRKGNFTKESVMDSNTGRMLNLINNQKYANQNSHDTTSTLHMGKSKTQTISSDDQSVWRNGSAHPLLIGCKTVKLF